jgi:hypothetical protein
MNKTKIKFLFYRNGYDRPEMKCFRQDEVKLQQDLLFSERNRIGLIDQNRKGLPQIVVTDRMIVLHSLQLVWKLIGSGIDEKVINSVFYMMN